MKFFSRSRLAHARTCGFALALAGVFASCASGSGSGPSSDDCADACAKVAAAACGDIGSECVSSCVRSAQAPTGTPCASERLSFASCFWGADSYICQASNGTMAPACSAQLDAYEACLSGDSGAGGAGGAPADSETAGAGGA